jgi:HSP20 family molecular chaperone IbpA
VTRDIHITRIITRTGEVAFQLRSLQFSSYQPPAATWSPNVNAVLYADRIEVCVELAGVRKEDLEVRVDGDTLRIAGSRDVLGPGCRSAPGCRVLVMEIDEGRFERVLHLPRRVAVDPVRVTARQEDGLLRIEVPLER